MARPSPREVARRVVRRVDREGAFISLALDGELERAGLADEDRALATELAYGVIRQRARLHRALSAHAPRGLGKLSPQVAIALDVAAYQILFLERVPAYAAVDDAVGAVRRTAGPRVAGFANGLLRQLARAGEPPLPDPEADPIAHIEVACSLPRWLADELAAQVPAADLVPAARALTSPAPLWARIDPARTTPADLARTLAGERPGATCRPSDLAPGAVQLERAGSPDKSRSFHDGLWTVQDLGAQLVGHLVGVRPGQRVLDACAGVGGKSTHLAQLAGDAAIIDAADLSPRKLDLLTDTARRLGLRSIRPVQADLTRPPPELAGPYDAIVLDAPCTGLGVLRRHPEAAARVARSAPAELARLQRALIEALVPHLAPGGVLVYSVCTFTRAEGPDQLAALLADHPELSLEPPPPADPPVNWPRVLAPDGTLRTWPHRHGADAFFAARLRLRPR